MKAIFNSRITSLEKISFDSKNRGFRYGDGLFETIVTGPERINLVGLHVKRIKSGCEILDIDFQGLNADIIKEMIEQLVCENKISGEAKSRLRIWRKPSGLYAPSTSESEFSLEVEPNYTEAFSFGNHIGVSEMATLHYSSISFAKTMSAMQYVIAGLEMKKKNLDEIIILNSSGYLAETHSSNLFWIKNNIIYTPCLSSGCISGVMRTHLMSIYQVKEVLASPSVLNFADSIFTTNVSGIKYFKNYQNRTYASPENHLTELIKQLQRP